MHIQNIILDSRQAVYNNHTSSSILHDTSVGGIPSSIRRRRELYTPTTNCIESYHVSIVPEEVNTCTNSNYYVSSMSLVDISHLWVYILFCSHLVHSLMLSFMLTSYTINSQQNGQRLHCKSICSIQHQQNVVLKC